MNLSFLSSISVKNVCATLLSGTTICGISCVSGTKIIENGVCLANKYLATGGTAVCATTAGNALALCGCVPSCFLGATACAADSAKLNNQSASYYAPIASPNFTTCIQTPLMCSTGVVKGTILTGSTCVCSPIICATTCVASPVLYGSTCSNSPLHCGACTLATTCVCSPVILGSTCICSPIILGSTYICSPIITGSTKVCSPIVCGTSCITSPITCGTTCAVSPIICASSCVRSALVSGTTVCAGSLTISIVCGTTCVASPITCGTTCVASPIILGSTCICGALICSTACVINTISCASSCVRSPLISGGTVCGLTTVCGGIICATTCFVGSGAGLTGTANSLTAGNALCLGGALANTYAPLASPAFTGNICNTTVGGALCLTRCGSSILMKTLYFANDADNGTGDKLYLTQAGGDDIRLKTNNCTRLTIDSTGNVGIGCTAPAVKLQVNDATAQAQALFTGYASVDGRTNSDSGTIQFGNNVGYNGLISYSSQGTTKFSIDNTYDNAGAVTQFRMRTLGTPVTAMTILGSGDIGIGATGIISGEKLNINGRLRIGSYQAYGGGESISIAECTNIQTALQLWQAGVADIKLGSKANLAALYLTNDYNGGGLGDAAYSLTISYDGKFGIGTIVPDQLLHIQKDQNAPTILKIRNNDSGSGNYSMVAVNSYGNSWGMRMGSTAANSNSLEFVLDALGTPVAKLTITTAGAACFAGSVSVGTNILMTTGAARCIDWSTASTGNGSVLLMVGNTGLSCVGATACCGGAVCIRAGAGGTATTTGTGGAGGILWLCGGCGGSGSGGATTGTGGAICMVTDGSSAIVALPSSCVILYYCGNSRLCTVTNGICIGSTCGFGTDWIATSDKRLKTNIQPISSALSMINHLCGICYCACDDCTCENRIGLIAQDVLKIIPEIVSHSQPNEEDMKYGICDEKLGLKYDKLTAVLVEAIKEQQKQINCLCYELNYIRNSNT